MNGTQHGPLHLSSDVMKTELDIRAYLGTVCAAIARASGATFIHVLLPSPWDHPTGVAPFLLRPNEVTESARIAARKSLSLMKTLIKRKNSSIADASHVLDRLPIDNSTYLDELGHSYCNRDRSLIS